MGTFYQLQGKSSDLIDNGDTGLSFFERKYSNIKPFSIVNREYPFSFHAKNNYEFKIPYDGHLIKNIYLKADIEIEDKNKEISEWKDLKIFDNPHFLNYEISNVKEMDSIDLEPIYKNLKALVYNDYLEKYKTEEWKNNILYYFHEENILEESSSTINNEIEIIKDIISYYNNETNLFESVDNDLIEYKKLKVLYLINFYMNVLYLNYNNLDNLYKIHSNRLDLTDTSIGDNYNLNDFVERYSFSYENNNINKVYLEEHINVYINDLNIRLQLEQNRQNRNDINNISTLDYEKNYEIYLNNKLLELNENIWNEDIIDAFDNNDGIASSTDDSIGKINTKYNEFTNNVLLETYLVLYESSNFTNNIEIIDTSDAYYEIYLKFIKDINSYINDNLIINEKYRDIFDLDSDSDSVKSIDNSILESILENIKNDHLDILDFYNDYEAISSINLENFRSIQEIKDNIFSVVNEYQLYNIPLYDTDDFFSDDDDNDEEEKNKMIKYIEDYYSQKSVEENVLYDKLYEKLYKKLIDKYDFTETSEEMFYIIYNDNEDILIHEYKLININLTNDEEEELRKDINDYNQTKDELYKISIKDKFDDFDLNLFDVYPFYNFENVTYEKKKYFDIFKNIILLQSRLNPIFLEEMYHEYVYERKLNIKKEYNIDIKINISNFEEELDGYQKLIIQSYTFYNRNYFNGKIPAPILESINDIHKYKYFHILDYENFIEYTRTNYEYFMYLYNEWNKKLLGNKKWKYLKQIEYKGLEFTYVELKHILLIERNICDVSSTDYEDYLSLLYKNINTKFENYIKTEIFDIDFSNIKLKINVNNNIELDIPRGKHNLSNNMYINKVYLYSNSSCILYYENNYRNIAYIFENNTEETKLFYVRKKIKSVYLYPYKIETNTNVSSSFLTDDYDNSFSCDNEYSTSIMNIFNINDKKSQKYVEYKFLTMNTNFENVVYGNDIYFDFSENKFIRYYDPQKNVYLYNELYRWILYNDFNDLINKKYTKEKFRKIELDTFKQKNKFDSITLQIGDQIIESLCEDTLEIYKNYFTKNKRGFDKLSENKYIPLAFWFMRNKGSSFPIMSLTNTNIYLNIKCNENIKVRNNASIIIDYILLSPEERNEMIIKDHVYILNTFNQKLLIVNGKNDYLQLPFNSQIVDLFLIFYDNLNKKIEITKYLSSLKLKIDGKESVKYYDLKLHTHVNIWNSKYKNIDKNIINISFALNPTYSEQPSGTMNYASITDSVIKFIFQDKTFYEIYKYTKIIFRDYKYLKINSGQGALI